MRAPLEDITVLEIDNWMAAPSAGALLADLGATVIKIEPLSGDPMRDMSRPLKLESEPAHPDLLTYDFHFDVDNRGKKSIAVALDTPEGAALVHRLVKDADIFMCNLLKRRQEKFKLDPEHLFKFNPKLVHATLTGYGTSGPEAWRPGYDVTAFFGRSGLYDSMREGDDGVVPMARPAQGDHTAGLAMVTGMLAALRQAERTGEGQAVETSLFETAVWTQATDFSVTAMDRAPVRKRARKDMLTPTANRYPCGDGKWVVFNMPEPKHWPKFATAIGRADLLDNADYATPKDRYRRMAEITEIVDTALAAKSRDEWGPIFDEAGIIWGPVLGLHEVAADPQAHALGLFPIISHSEMGDYRTVNIPMRFANTDVKPRGPSPVLGEHTRSVLQGAGLSAEDVEELRARNIIGESSTE